MPILRFPDPALDQFSKAGAEAIERVNEQVLERLAQVGLRLDAKEISLGSIQGAVGVGAAIVERDEIREIVMGTLGLADEFHKEEVKRGFREAGRSLAIEVDLPDEALADFRTHLTDRFSDSIDEHLDFIERVTIDGVKKGKRASDIANDFAERTDVAKDKMELLGRDTLGSLKSFQDQHRMQRLGVEQYRWLTAKDERVRTTHKILHGTVQRYDQPPLVGHPGEDYLCRCNAAPQI